MSESQVQCSPVPSSANRGCQSASHKVWGGQRSKWIDFIGSINLQRHKKTTAPFSLLPSTHPLHSSLFNGSLRIHDAADALEGKPLKSLVCIRAVDREYGPKLLSKFMALRWRKKEKETAGRLEKRNEISCFEAGVTDRSHCRAAAVIPSQLYRAYNHTF